MNWKPDKDKPICPQLCEHMSSQIAAGYYKPHDKLPSVRELAVLVGVNPNTVQRSYEILEGQGIIYTMRGNGRYVAEDITRSQESIKKLRVEKTREYFSQMKLLGFDTDETKDYIKEWSE